jgi:hypothetical protein
MQLRNHKRRYLGSIDKKGRYAIDAFIGAVQMSENGKVWEDIKPRLLRDSDGWHVEGAPYYAEVKDDGSRLFCPDRDDKSKYLRILSFPLVQNLNKNILSSETKIDRQILPNRVRMPTEWGYVDYIFSNTGMQFQIFFETEPPAGVFGKDSPRILLDQETAGLDISELLSAEQGLGIPKPRLIEVNTLGEPQERWLDWSYKNGQLELGFDLTGLKFPVLLKNTSADDQIDASNDDTTCEEWNNYNTSDYLHFPYTASYRAFMRFPVDVPSGATIDDGCYIKTYLYLTGQTTGTVQLQQTDEDDAADFSTLPWSRSVTDSTVNWEVATGNQYDERQSPEIKTIVQDKIDRGDFDQGDHIAIRASHVSGGPNFVYQYDGSSTYAPKLHIEYTAGGGEFGIDELEEANRVYYEAYDGTVLDGRTDVTEQSEEERATTLASFKAAFPGDDYYQHNHSHNGTPAPCTQESV